MRIGIEIGGTFTDLICIEAGQIKVTKVPSTPANPEIGFGNALSAAGVSIPEIEELAHGSTVATNAVLERKGANVLLVTTAGFRDALWIQRQSRARIYELVYQKPAPVLPRRQVLEVRERIASDGSIVQAVDVESFKVDLSRAIEEVRPEVVAIALINGYTNPVHERLVRDTVEAIAPHIGTMCSHEISPEFREYERFTTTTLSAYVQPVISRYLDAIQANLARDGFRGQVSLMQSNGGRLPARAMQKNPITALYSGPAAGVAGANLLAARAGRSEIITFDMGGTSADVCLISGNKPALKSGTSIDGLPVRSPVLDIATVGAGGGSHIWRDEGGMLRVGPTSSGASPGPASYGRGGTLPTITDAHVVCGTLRPERFLGGKARLDIDAARKAFQGLASAFGLSLEEVADSAIRVANASIVRAIQAVSTEVGRDPRQHALMAFGGAGPLHAGRIAELLGVREVLLPRHAGVLSALGLLASQFTVYETQTKKTIVDGHVSQNIAPIFEALERSARTRLKEAGVDQEPQVSFTLQMRYSGQAFELDVPVPSASANDIDEELLRRLYEDAVSGQMNFRPGAKRPIEIVGFRCGATAQTSLSSDVRSVESSDPKPEASCRILENREERTCKVIGWPDRGAVLRGPTIVDADTSTMYIPPGWSARLDDAGNCLIMTHEGGSHES